MPRGVPAAGFRKTKNFVKANPHLATAVVQSLPIVPKVHETDDQIRSRLLDSFLTLDKLADATFKGKNKTFIVSGPAGIGKSHGIMLMADLAEKANRKITHIKGFVRPTGLYKALFEARHANSIVIFDDADSVFADEIALNLLKAACDMTKVRHLHWRAETSMETEDGEPLPTSFVFEGAVIFITNYDFDFLIAKNNMRSPHLQAMISRSIYLDLGIKSSRDYMIRIEQIAPIMFRDNNVDSQGAKDIMAFINDNHDKFRELSLRMVLKLITLRNMDATAWQKLARATCFKAKV